MKRVNVELRLHMDIDIPSGVDALGGRYNRSPEFLTMLSDHVSSALSYVEPRIGYTPLPLVSKDAHTYMFYRTVPVDLEEGVS